MRYSKLFIILSLLAVLSASCKKGHYDVGNVHGVNAEGEVLLPLASATFSVNDMMERFQIDSLIECDATGKMWYNYTYEDKEAVLGRDLLRFDDMSIVETYEFDSPYPFALPFDVDTTFTMRQTIELQSDHIHILSASLASGTFALQFSNNVVELHDVVVRCAQIKDAEGQPFEMALQLNSGMASFDVSGLNYVSDEFDVLNFEYGVHVVVPQGMSDNEISFGLEVMLNDLTVKEMWGWVEPYVTKNKIDTVFDLFPDNVFGTLEVRDVVMSMRVKNGFSLMSKMIIDTALVSGPGIEPFSIFEPMPQVVEMPFTPSYSEVFHENLHGLVCAHGGHALATSEFILNHNGMTELVGVSDTCSIGVEVNAQIPLAFKADEVQYIDTVNMRLSAIESPEWMKKLTIELEITSTIPLNMNGVFYMYDIDNECVTDTLVGEPLRLPASFDGTPTHATASIEITEDRLDKVMDSERIIMCYDVDTGAHDVAFNINQTLQFFVKARVEYDGVVELKND